MAKQNKALKKMLLQDRAKEYEQIKKMKKMLEEEIEATLSRKEHYIEAINGKIHDSKLLKEQQDHINKLEAENKRLKGKLADFNHSRARKYLNPCLGNKAK